MMSSENRRRIFYFCGRLGMTDEDRHTVQFSACGKESLSDMSDVDAEAVIQALKREIRKRSIQPGRSAHRRVHGENVHLLISPEQRDKIVAMSMQIYGKFNESSMDAFCRRMFRKPFRRIDSNEAITLIESQKKILQRKLKKEITGGRP